MDISSWTRAFGQEFSALLGQIAAYLPRLLLALVLLVAGWLLAKLLRALSVRLLLGADRLWHRFIARRGLDQFQPYYPPARVAGEIVFWFVMLFVVAGAASLLGLGAFAQWLSQLVTYLPILLTGLLIILAGVVLSTLLRELIATAAHRAGIAQSELLGRFGQAAVLLTAIAVGVDQIGVDITFLSIVVGVALAAAFGGAALAFGLGARDYMGNVIAAQQLRKVYRPGDWLRVHGHEGTVLELTPTKVVLRTDQGRVVVPAKLFEQEVAVTAEAASRENQ